MVMVETLVHQYNQSTLLNHSPIYHGLEGLWFHLKLHLSRNNHDNFSELNIKKEHKKREKL